MAAATAIMEPVGQHRSILPRPPTTANGEHADGRSGTVAKRQQVLVACAACQKRKSKCTGQRPKCSLCELKDTECVYDTRAGEARGAHLKRKVTELTQEITYLKQCVETLRTSPWNEAMDLLHRIQTTPHLDDALKLITDSSILLSVRNRSGNDSSPGQADGHSESPSPTPEMPKKKRLRTEESASSTSSQAPRDPRMSIEQLTCIAAEASPPKRSLPYPPVHHVMDGVLPRIELRNWGSVTSEETDP